MSPTVPSIPHSMADLAELGRLFDEHRPRLLATIERRIDRSLAVRVDAGDVLNNAFLDACREWPRTGPQAAMTVYAWLYGIVYDRLIELWRTHTRERRDLRRELPWPDRSSIQMGLSLIDPALTPKAAAVREELRELVRQALRLLKHADHEILWMRHIDGLSIRESAAVLKLDDNMTSARYVRALKRFKQLWLQLDKSGASKP